MEARWLRPQLSLEWHVGDTNGHSVEDCHRCVLQSLVSSHLEHAKLGMLVNALNHVVTKIQNRPLVEVLSVTIRNHESIELTPRTETK